VTQNSAPVFQGDALVGAVLAITDVTDERRDARDLEMVERMASLARHSRAIAHDTNNALTVVGANLLFLSDQCDLVAESTDRVVSDDVLGESRRALSDATKGVSQVQSVVGRLRMFGSDESMTASIEPADVIRWALSVSERQWRGRARLRLEIDGMPRVEADEARLAQVMLELITRAASAIRRDEGEHHELAVIGGRDADGRALIRITTTATPPDLIEESPAVASAGAGAARGAPSKLALCASIVRSLGGSLETERPSDGGDEARVRLPAARVVRMPRPTRPLSMLGTGRHGKILVVDDEELVSQVVSRVLGSEHDVVSVLSGREAIELLSRGVTFDAVVCDVVMPDVNGLDVYYWIRAQQPALMRSFMFLTGGATDAKTVRHFDSLTVTSMEKPFRPSELRALVANLVGRRRA
jgi:two-component system, NtrC family, sensor kinase